jgi:hypothetical protein
MRTYSYIVESLPDGRWRWTVFGEGHKAVRSGSAKDEHAAKLAAVNAIDELKMRAGSLASSSHYLYVQKAQ